MRTSVWRWLLSPWTSWRAWQLARATDARELAMVVAARAAVAAEYGDVAMHSSNSPATPMRT
ncbi:hypothetical protein QQY66_03490 [Streptomyces sp. DG2A-72]|uniref:hypothetical protein n=1 Tax=Streptomyces sp. DG2A-72 TaxID=3051386 RepID=UPI00265BCD9F|nr:hypothetical protein [Streptomyces sp. DG2A-72]MDO0930785.1 hypothetical protein [Streptomyces sp. DG2A-72]